MWFLYIISWIALLIQLVFITLSIAAGLFYMAELVEEYTVMTGKIIGYMIWFVTVVFVGMILFEEFPLSLTGTGLLANLIYLLVLRTFPYTELTSPVFIISVVLILVNHYLAFSYFATVWHPFSDVLAYFTVCLWLVPFAFFVSLSANDNVLPTLSQPGPTPADEADGDIVSNYFKRSNKKYGLLTFLKSAQESLLPQRMKKAF